MGQHYTENFVQCTLTAMGDKLARSTLVVGGDGRYYGKEATEKIIRMCAANKVHRAYCCRENTLQFANHSKIRTEIELLRTTTFKF